MYVMPSLIAPSSAPSHHSIEMLAAYFLADSKLFKRIIHAVKRLLCSRFVSHGRAKPDEGSVAAVRFLSMLYNVNEYAVKLSKTDGPSAEDYSDTADTEERHTYSIVPFSTFYCTVDSSDNDGMVLRRFDYKIEYIAWRKLNNAAGSSNTATASFSLLNYPFLFDPIAKARVLRVESMTSMTGGFEEAFVNNAFVTQAQKVLDGLDALERVPPMRVSVAADNDHDDDDEDAPSDVSGASADDGDHDDDDDEDKEVDGAQRNKTTRAPFDSAQLERAFEKVTVPYLVMEIRREHLVEDAIAQITAKAGDLHKPLKIKFVGGGEEGLDQGMTESAWA